MNAEPNRSVSWLVKGPFRINAHGFQRKRKSSSDWMETPRTGLHGYAQGTGRPGGGGEHLTPRPQGTDRPKNARPHRVGDPMELGDLVNLAHELPAPNGRTYDPLITKYGHFTVSRRKLRVSVGA